MTNFERITQNPAALAEHMCSERGNMCDMCTHGAASAATMDCTGGERCEEGIEAWLNAEAANE